MNHLKNLILLMTYYITRSFAMPTHNNNFEPVQIKADNFSSNQKFQDIIYAPEKREEGSVSNNYQIIDEIEEEYYEDYYDYYVVRAYNYTDKIVLNTNIGINIPNIGIATPVNNSNNNNNNTTTTNNNNNNNNIGDNSNDEYDYYDFYNQYVLPGNFQPDFNIANNASFQITDIVISKNISNFDEIQEDYYEDYFDYYVERGDFDPNFEFVENKFKIDKVDQEVMRTVSGKQINDDYFDEQLESVISEN